VPLLAALSTENKIGLALVGGAFILFALASAFLIPALRPEYPGRRGLPAFLTLSVALFVGMMFAIFFLAREPEEGQAEGGTRAAETTAAETTAAETTTQATTTQATTEATSREATTTAPAAPKKVAVSETEFKIQLATNGLSAGRYTFELKNDGKIGHDLVVDGPGVDNEKTPVIGSGKTASLTVDLKSGTYELYCSVPGHKQAGMDLKLDVS
jgi:uncharacterized cupredoxin-like copper-binding protein